MDGQKHLTLLEAYTNALLGVGLTPVVLPLMDPLLIPEVVRVAAGLVLTGGEDIDPQWFGEAPHPAAGSANVARDRYEIALALAAQQHRIPTLAICRGAQIMNVALGGSLLQDIASQRPGTAHPTSAFPSERVHAVDLDPTSQLSVIAGATHIHVNSSHHQAIDRLAPSFRVTGRSSDGIVEAIETTDDGWWMVGVQWHPEDLLEGAEHWDRRLFSAFADQVLRDTATVA